MPEPTKTPTNTPTEATRFERVDTPAASENRTPEAQPRPVQTPVSDRQANEFVLTGHTPARSFMPRDDEERSGEALEQVTPAQAPRETPTNQERVEEGKRLYAKKYKTIEDFEKAHTELERKLHDPSLTRKTVEEKRELQRQLQEREREIEFLRSRVPKEEFSDDKFNEDFIQNPAKAIQSFYERQKQSEELERAEQKRTDDLRRLNENIHGNIAYMEGEYPEFASNKQEFAEWMRELHVDSGAVMADKTLAQDAYRSFLLSEKQEEITEEARREGALESHEKLAQVPGSPSATSQHPANRQGNTPNSRFERVGGENKPPQTVSDPLQKVRQSASEEDILDELDRKVGVAPQGQRMF